MQAEKRQLKKKWRQAQMPFAEHLQSFKNLLDKPEKRIVGLMSGTSADGVDVALVSVVGSGRTTEIALSAFDTVPYPVALRARLFDLFNVETARIDEICTMNFVLGQHFAKSVLRLLARVGVSPAAIDLIGSHGQTIHHMPKAPVPATLQIGEPAVIAHETGIPVVADFRVADVAAGGEGAPLVGYVDYLLFQHERQTVGLLNIGGIANLTVLPAGCVLAAVHASDTGPGNMILDACVQKITSGTLQFDHDAALAMRGTVCEPLLERWLAHPFFELSPPKTTGREMFGTRFTDTYLQQMHDYNISEHDGLATLTALTVRSIFRYYVEYVMAQTPLDILYVSGGGARNPLLIRGLADAFDPIPVVDVSETGVSGDAKEAIAFAILANEAVHGHCSNVPNATGAACRKILGKFVCP